MSQLNAYTKAIVGALIAGLGAYGVAVSDGSVTATELTTVAVAFLTALGVIWGVPNEPQLPVVKEVNNV